MRPQHVPLHLPRFVAGPQTEDSQGCGEQPKDELRTTKVGEGTLMPWVVGPLGVPGGGEARCGAPPRCGQPLCAARGELGLQVGITWHRLATLRPGQVEVRWVADNSKKRVGRIPEGGEIREEWEGMVGAREEEGTVEEGKQEVMPEEGREVEENRDRANDEL